MQKQRLFSVIKTLHPIAETALVVDRISRLLIVLLVGLIEAEPDRQIDSGMLKRVNPGHPLTLIS